MSVIAQLQLNAYVTTNTQTTVITVSKITIIFSMFLHYHYCCHHRLMFCAIMYCRRRNTNYCLHWRLVHVYVSHYAAVITMSSTVILFWGIWALWISYDGDSDDDDSDDELSHFQIQISYFLTYFPRILLLLCVWVLYCFSQVNSLWWATGTDCGCCVWRHNWEWRRRRAVAGDWESIELLQEM